MALDKEDLDFITGLLLRNPDRFKQFIRSTDDTIYEVVSQGYHGFMVVLKRDPAPVDIEDVKLNLREGDKPVETDSVGGVDWYRLRVECSRCRGRLSSRYRVSKGQPMTLIVDLCDQCSVAQEKEDCSIHAGVDPASEEGDYSATTARVQNEDGSWTDISGAIKSFKLDLGGEKMETTNAPSKQSRIDTEHVRYAAKVYRTEIVENEIEYHIEVMLTSLAGEDKKIYVREDPTSCQDMAAQRGIKYGPERNHKWVADCDGWTRTGRTRAVALASLLSCLLDGPFYPRT